MPDLPSSNEPVVIIFYLIGLINLVQGIFYTYKYSKGFGTLFTWKELLGAFTSGKRVVGSFPRLNPPNKATKDQRNTLLIFAVLLFLSVFIMFQLVGMVK